MGCHLHSSNPQILPTKNPAQLPSFSSIQPKLRIQTKISSSSSSSSNQNQYPPISTTTTTITQKQLQPKTDACSVKFKTMSGCKLGISSYPDFEYNAQGGTGDGRGRKLEDDDESNGEISVGFDLKTLYIPPLMGTTTRFLGLPLPPFLKIDIVPELFEGIVNPNSGKVNLKFKAKFWFSIGSIYRAPPLLVETVLTSEESKGMLRRGRGQRLNEEGKCRLVGVATVNPIDDFLMDSFLGLPTECLAVLNATISFSDS